MKRSCSQLEAEAVAGPSDLTTGNRSISDDDYAQASTSAAASAFGLQANAANAEGPLGKVHPAEDQAGPSTSKRARRESGFEAGDERDHVDLEMSDLDLALTPIKELKWLLKELRVPEKETRKIKQHRRSIKNRDDSAISRMIVDEELNGLQEDICNICIH